MRVASASAPRAFDVCIDVRQLDHALLPGRDVGVSVAGRRLGVGGRQASGAADVLQREQTGQRLGISGVPFFVVNGGVARPGARPPVTFRAEIEQETAAWAGEACGADPATGGREC